MKYENSYSLPSLTRATIGFDELFEQLSGRLEKPSYPPYNIIHHGNDDYEIEMAVAGFTMEELSIVHEKNILRIQGSKNTPQQKLNYLHKGIGNRSFKSEFTLADHVEVYEAKLEYGLLKVKLFKRIPEELQPKTIEIKHIS